MHTYTNQRISTTHDELQRLYFRRSEGICAGHSDTRMGFNSPLAHRVKQAESAGLVHKNAQVRYSVYMDSSSTSLQKELEAAILARLEDKSTHMYQWPRWAAAYEASEAAAPIVDRVRTEAWEQAHAQFCPRAQVCSTHLRPGDRHLLRP